MIFLVSIGLLALAGIALLAALYVQRLDSGLAERLARISSLERARSASMPSSSLFPEVRPASLGLTDDPDPIEPEPVAFADHTHHPWRAASGLQPADRDGPGFNPASGLPMSGALDIAGNPFRCDFSSTPGDMFDSPMSAMATGIGMSQSPLFD